MSARSCARGTQGRGPRSLARLSEACMPGTSRPAWCTAANKAPSHHCQGKSKLYHYEKEKVLNGPFSLAVHIIVVSELAPARHAGC